MIKKLEINCSTCQGVDISSIDNSIDWCECEESSGSYYIPQNRHRDIWKNHWRCNSCNKIIQIG